MRFLKTPAGLAVSAVALVAAVAAVAVLALRGDEPEPVADVTTDPSPTTEPTPEPTPEPTEEPTEQPPAAEPFEVRLVEADGLHVVSTDNAPVVSRESLPIDEQVAEEAAEIARASFEEFLNAQFTDPETWFGDEAIEALLTPRAGEALRDEDRAALGRLDIDVGHVVTGDAEADPMITMHGERPRNVTLEFSATLTVVAPDDTTTPLLLSGAMVFVPTDDGWLVEAVDATLAEDTAT